MKHIDIYQNPEVYEAILAQSPPEIEKEVEFIDSLPGLPGAGSVLDLCCGTCLHSIELADKGWDVVGVDCSEVMLNHAQKKALERGVALETVCGDIKQFSLTKSFDTAICCHESILHLLNNDEWYSHFNSVAKHLKTDGLYYVVLDSPEKWLGQVLGPQAERQEYYNKTTHINNLEYQVKMFSSAVNFHTGIYEWGISVNVLGENGTEEGNIESVNDLRVLTTQEFCALVDASGVFTVEGLYGDFDLDTPLTEGANKRIAVLKKRAVERDDHMRHIYKNVLLDEVWSQGDVDQADGILSTKFKDHSPIDLYPDDKEGHKRMALDWHNAFPDMKLVVEEMVVEGDLLVGRYSGKGTHRGMFDGFSPTGVCVEISAIDIMRFDKDNKITDWWHNEDLNGLYSKIQEAAKE